MRDLVVYYSFEGNTEYVADKICTDSRILRSVKTLIFIFILHKNRAAYAALISLSLAEITDLSYLISH